MNIEENKLSSLFRRLYKHISNHRKKQFLQLSIIMIFATFSEAMSIGVLIPFVGVLTEPERVYTLKFLQPFLQPLNITGPEQLILPFTMIFSFAIVLSNAFRLLLIWAQNRLSYAIGTDLSYKIYRLTLFQPYSVHQSRNSSEVIVGIANKAKAIVNNTIMPVLVMLNSAFMILVIMITLITINPTLILSTFIGFGFIYLLVVSLTRGPLKRESLHISRETNHVVKLLQEGLGGIRDVLIDGSQDVFCNIYIKTDHQLRKSLAKVSFIGSIPRFGVEALGMLLIVFLAYSFAKKTEGLTSYIPILVTLALGVQRLLPLMQQAYVSWTSIKGAEGSLNDTLDLLDQRLPNFANKPIPRPIQFVDNIKINKLFFRYTKHTPLVIKDLSLTIPKGSRVGFIGTTGSGKSTLLDIIMGLLTPTEGDITIDGVSLTEDNARSWQVHIAHVPQAIYLSDCTITENIAFGQPTENIDHQRVRQAAQKAQIAETIELLERKYDTMVGERGIRLSGGQRQRIGIARALYKNADVIVFDEATSALDNNTEFEVMDAIQNLGEELTIFMVAHRLTTLKNCNLVVELENGKIKQYGTYNKIIGEGIK
jgi:ABC-type bacteriocin/lantibiotic exporter with double-glycine peptidase domain